MSIFFSRIYLLFFITDLKNIELQIVRGVCCPEDRVVCCLGTKFYLPQSLVGTSGCLGNRLLEQLRVHKVGAGTGCQKTAILDQLHSSEIDFPVTLHRIFNGIAGFGKGGRIQNNHIELFSLFLQFGKQIKYICTNKGNPVLQMIQPKADRQFLPREVNPMPTVRRAFLIKLILQTCVTGFLPNTVSYGAVTGTPVRITSIFKK